MNNLRSVRGTSGPTRFPHPARGWAPGGMARQMENLGIGIPQAPGSLSIPPAPGSPSIPPAPGSPSIPLAVPINPKRGLIRIVTAKELAEGSLQISSEAVSLSTSTPISASISKGESSMLSRTSEPSADRDIDDTLRTKDPDPAISTPAPIKVSSLQELLDLVFAQHMADVKSMTISMILVDGSKLVINAEM